MFKPPQKKLICYYQLIIKLIYKSFVLTGACYFFSILKTSLYYHRQRFINEAEFT